jgi:hypothetical protein
MNLEFLLILRKTPINVLGMLFIQCFDVSS